MVYTPNWETEDGFFYLTGGFSPPDSEDSAQKVFGIDNAIKYWEADINWNNILNQTLHWLESWSHLERFCKDNNIVLIEDASEAHGQFYNSRKCGTYGKISTLSFYANKHIISGEGGAVLLDDKENYLKLRQMINLDFDSSKRFQHDNLYENYRISGLSAALGKSQIKSIKKIITKKTTNIKSNKVVVLNPKKKKDKRNPKATISSTRKY